MGKSSALQRLIQNALNEIDWDFVLKCYTSLNLEYPGDTSRHLLTKEILQHDLAVLIGKVLNDEMLETFHHHWLIYWDSELKVNQEPYYTLEVFFAPLSSWQENSNRALTDEQASQSLQEQLQTALHNEDYEEAQRIHNLLSQIKHNE